MIVCMITGIIWRIFRWLCMVGVVDTLFPAGDPAANPQLLVAAREALGMTQAQLAARLSELAGPGQKISQGYVSRAESGALAVTGTRLELFARALESGPGLLAARRQDLVAGRGLPIPPAPRLHQGLRRCGRCTPGSTCCGCTCTGCRRWPADRCPSSPGCR